MTVRKLNTIQSIRFNKEDMKLIRKAAAFYNMPVSAFIRMSALEYLEPRPANLIGKDYTTSSSGGMLALSDLPTSSSGPFIPST